MELNRKRYRADTDDDERVFVAPCLPLMMPQAPQRQHDLHQVFNALRWIVRARAPWRLLPNDLPLVYQQTQRWLAAGCFAATVHALRSVLQLAQARAPDPTVVILESRADQSTPESGHRAGYDGANRHKGSKVHAAVDTLGLLLALKVTPASEQDRAQVGELAQRVQAVPGEPVEPAYVDQDSTGLKLGASVEAQAIQLKVVKLPEVKRGFILLPRRRVVERSHAWMARFCRLARDYQRLPATAAGLHFVVFALLMLSRMIVALNP